MQPLRDSHASLRAETRIMSGVLQRGGREGGLERGVVGKKQEMG